MVIVVAAATVTSARQWQETYHCIGPRDSICRSSEVPRGGGVDVETPEVSADVARAGVVGWGRGNVVKVLLHIGEVW